MNIHFNKKIALVFLISALSVLAFAGCGNVNGVIGDVDGGSDADAVFVIMKNTTVSAEHKDFLRLININGKTYDSAYDLTFSCEEGKNFISFTGTDGVIETGDVSSNESAIITARSDEGSTKIKVVVINEYKAKDFADSKNAIIPYGIDTIDADFAGSSIEFLRVPGTITYIPNSAFSECKSLETVELPDFLSSIGSGAFIDCTNLTKVSMPNELSTIGENAFRNCTFDEIHIPENIIKIDSFAFSTCRNLKSVEVPASIIKIEGKTFQNCESLSDVTLDEGLQIIGESAFSECASLKIIQFPSTLKEIGDRAFSYCDGLEKLDIPTSVTKLGEEAFYNCKSISEVTIPASLGILKDAFFGVSGVSYVHLTGSGIAYDYSEEKYIYTPWYQSRFNDMKVDIDEGITTIGEYQFVKCYGVTHINLPSTITHIRHGAFRKCYNLTDINIPNGVKVIERYAFSICRSLENIELPNTVRVIENNAFQDCKSLKEITVPNSVYKIEASAFAACPALEKVTLGTDSGSLLKVIGNEAFRGAMPNLKNVTINSTRIQSVGNKAFGYEKELDFADKSFDAINIGFMAKDSVIKVKSSNIAKKLVPNVNYNKSTTKVIIG